MSALSAGVGLLGYAVLSLLLAALLWRGGDWLHRRLDLSHAARGYWLLLWAGAAMPPLLAPALQLWLPLPLPLWAGSVQPLSHSPSLPMLGEAPDVAAGAGAGLAVPLPAGASLILSLNKSQNPTVYLKLLNFIFNILNVFLKSVTPMLCLSLSLNGNLAYK